MARRAAYVCAPLLTFCASSGILTAQTLKITEPKDGAVVYAGYTMTVVVEASPALAFREVIIIGQSAIGFSRPLATPPYRFSMTIPPNTLPRRYELRADGTTESGRGATSEPVGILVERSDSPLSLTAEPAVLDFHEVGVQCPVAAVGKFADAPRVDLHESSYVKFTSENPSVATVNQWGLVTTTGFGSARITIEYNGKSTVVPVTVRKPAAGR
ncbi:MAG: Ig-like domain-containing protein [Bryobacteraceae bacterium]